MRSTRLHTFILLLALFYGCNDKNQQGERTLRLKVVEAKGYVVPKDSMAKPTVIFIDESKLKKNPCGKPKVIPTNTNIHIAINTNIRKAGILKVCTPGTDTFSLPKIVPAIDSPFVAGIPKIRIAKDAYTKDQNPENFFSFKKLQGLNSNNLFCLIEDKAGNLWLGTDGGVTKYDGKYFTYFTEKEGLSSNNIKSILEDKYGNLWFGTEGGGVSKYDGKNFTHFTTKEGLNNNTVRTILEDKDGNLWFGTEGGGVTKYDGKSFTNFTTQEGLGYNLILSCKEDKYGNIWFGTNGGGVTRYDGKSFTNITTKEGLSNDKVSSILEDKDGNIWFSTEENGVTKYDGKYFTYFTEKERLNNNDVMSSMIDKYGNIWFSTFDGGISKYNGKSFTYFTEKEGLSNNRIMSNLEDKYGNIWFGTFGGGLSKYDGKTFTHYTKTEGLSNNVILSSLEDKYGNIWLGTYGSGVIKYDGKFFTQFTKKEGLCDNRILCSLEDKYGNIWFGTYGGGVTKYDGNRVEAIERGEKLPQSNQQYLRDKNGKLIKSFTHFTEKEKLSNNTVRSILEDKNGNLWFGTENGGVTKYDGNNFTNFTTKEGLSNNNIFNILEDKNGNIWFGTKGGGVTKYNGKNFTHFTEKEGLGDNFVCTSIEDKYGNIWLGTDGGGVSKYDGKNFTYYTEEQGLGNNCVYSSMEDEYGNLWFGTRFGLSKLSQSLVEDHSKKIISKNAKKTTVLFKNYSYDDGFLGIGCTINSICETKDGTIWTGTNDRLTVYHPEGETIDTIAPNIQLVGITLFNENINWANLEKRKDSILILSNGVSISNIKFNGVSKWYSVPENLSLAFNNNYLSFNFIGITMAHPQKVQYQYKLEGIDESWSALTNKTEASYGNLPHGDYTFKVKAMNSEGYYSNELSYTFTIRPPWWKTWWFRTLVGLLFISSIVFYIKWRERSLKAEKVILEQIVAERTAEVIDQKKRIEEKHKEISDSINYAERIQRSFLATKELLDENLQSYFVLFEPKDVVSGDFYWAAKLSNGNFVLVTADSTGHGVPGAIMSILNISCLEKAIETLIQPAAIFNSTRKTIIDRLKKDGSAEGGKDGMDASLICFDFLNLKLVYAAANNPIWVVRQNMLIELKPDKMPVGKHDKDQISFTQYEFDLEKEDVIYALTDGFPDQFGGPNGKKFMTKQLKELLISIAPLQMAEQNEILKSSLNNWKGDLEQVDDVCLIGIRV